MLIINMNMTKKMDKIKINPFVSAYHGKHVDFNKRGFLVRVFFYT